MTKLSFEESLGEESPRAHRKTIGADAENDVVVYGETGQVKSLTLAKAARMGQPKSCCRVRAGPTARTYDRSRSGEP